MKCAIMQPTYIPWLGYFDLIDSVDKFIFLDDVKLEKCSWHVRNRIKSSNGEIYLTIPVKNTVGRDKLQINKTIMSESCDWRKKHLKSIFFAYKKAAFFETVYPFMETLINAVTDKLIDFNYLIITAISKKIGIDKQFIRSSELSCLYGEKDLRVVSICKAVGCDEYLSPQGSAVYIEKESPGGAFAKNNVALFYHNYKHPVYSQLYADFLPFMSVIDLLFNCGFDDGLQIIREGRGLPIDYVSFRKLHASSNIE